MSRLSRASLSAHSLLGIVLGALIYQICLTGTLAVFAPDWKRWEQPQAPLVRAAAPEAFAAAVAEGLARAADPRATVVLLGPTPALPRMEVRLPGQDGGGWTDADGRIVGPVRTPWANFVSELHENLHLQNRWGPLLVGIVGIALLAALLSGVLAHRRIFRDAFHLRLGRSPRLENADLHNRASVWGLPFHLIVAFTGAFLALLPPLLAAPLALLAHGGDADTATSALLGPAATSDLAPAPLPDLARLIREVESARAPARVSFVLLEQAGTAGRLLLIDTDGPRELVSGESHRFRGQGEPLGSAGYTDGPVEVQMLAAMYPLHVGSFGGWPLRLLYGALGLGLCWITATGMRIWFVRLRARGQPAPRRERLWQLVLWGQPAALAAAALWAGFAQTGIVIVYLAVTALTLLSSAAPLRTARLARAWRLLTALLLIVLCVRHVLGQGVGGDPVAWLVDAALVGTALLLCLRQRNAG